MSESLNGGNGAASDDGAGSATASAGTGPGDTRPPTAGPAATEESDGSESLNGGNGAASDDGAGSATASAGTGPGDTRPPTAGPAATEESDGSESLNGGNGAASDDGAGSATASAGTGPGDTRPPTAGPAATEESDGSESLNGGNGAASDDGAGSATASAGTGPGDRHAREGSRIFKVTSYFLSSVQWAAGFISENPELINKAAAALANREQRLDKEEAMKQIVWSLEEIEKLAIPLGEPAKKPVNTMGSRLPSEPIKRARGLSKTTQLYLISRSTVLEGNYIRIRAELLASVTTNPDRATDKYARSAAESLQRAYGPLTKKEKKQEELNSAATDLCYADSFTASTLTKVKAVERARMLLPLLNVDKVGEGDDSLRTSLKDVIDKRDELSEEAIKGTLVTAIRRQWAASSDSYIAEDLQEMRIRSILRWLTATLVGLIIVVPLVIGLQTRSGAAKATFVWPMLRSLNTFGQSYIAVLAIALIGCVGGTLSALLAARDSRMRLETYRTDMLRALMRPIMGAVVAVLVYALLTWQVIPGVTVTNAGTYLLFALLAGFSERFFLKLLPLEGSSPEGGVDRRDSSPRIV